MWLFDYRSAVKNNNPDPGSFPITSTTLNKNGVYLMSISRKHLRFRRIWCRFAQATTGYWIFDPSDRHEFLVQLVRFRPTLVDYKIHHLHTRRKPDYYSDNHSTKICLRPSWRPASLAQRQSVGLEIERSRVRNSLVSTGFSFRQRN